MQKYEEFSSWLNDVVELGLIKLDTNNCETCESYCAKCVHNLIGLEEVCDGSKNVEDEFADRVTDYIKYNMRDQTLEPTSILDGYLTVLYFRYLRV